MSIYTEVQREEFTSATLPTDKDFQLWAESALKGRVDEGEICIRLVSAEESQQLNYTYRGKDKPTNVLSFPFEAGLSDIDLPAEIQLPAELDASGLEVNILGDLAICCAVVAEEAKAQNKTLKDHWAHMVVHGVLHLIGFDHINDQDADEMEGLEVEILAFLDISNPYKDDEE